MNANETDEMKNMWRDENKTLLEKLSLNEKLLNDMKFDKAVNKYDKKLRFSILGRNLALVYCVISLSCAIRLHDMPVYSIPAAIGGMAMLASFFSHRSLKRIDFEKLPVLDLQKSICSFRIHTEKMKFWDISVVMLWLITLAPAWLHQSLHLSIYENPKTAITFVLLLAIIVVGTIFFTRSLYRRYNLELQQAENMLTAISDFEKTS